MEIPTPPPGTVASELRLLVKKIIKKEKKSLCFQFYDDEVTYTNRPCLRKGNTSLPDSQELTNML